MMKLVVLKLMKQLGHNVFVDNFHDGDIGEWWWHWWKTSATVCLSSWPTVMGRPQLSLAQPGIEMYQYETRTTLMTTRMTNDKNENLHGCIASFLFVCCTLWQLHSSLVRMKMVMLIWWWWSGWSWELPCTRWMRWCHCRPPSTAPPWRRGVGEWLSWRIKVPLKCKKRTSCLSSQSIQKREGRRLASSVNRETPTASCHRSACQPEFQQVSYFGDFDSELYAFLVPQPQCHQDNLTFSWFPPP